VAPGQGSIQAAIVDFGNSRVNFDRDGTELGFYNRGCNTQSFQQAMTAACG